jgi:hypothetical protein
VLHGSGVATKSWLSVLRAEVRCVASTLAMLARNELALLEPNVGRFVVFTDGSSEAYRETAIRRRRYEGLVLIAVRFVCGSSAPVGSCTGSSDSSRCSTPLSSRPIAGSRQSHG